MVNPIFSFSQETKKVNLVLDSISGQYAECAAYYTIVYHAMVSSNKPETATNYGLLQEAAIKYSLLLASEGRSTEMAAKVTKSRMEMYMKKMKQEANNDNANISILIDKYHFGCQEALENPSKYVVEILQTKVEEVKGKSEKK